MATPIFNGPKLASQDSSKKGILRFSTPLWTPIPGGSKPYRWRVSDNMDLKIGPTGGLNFIYEFDGVQEIENIVNSLKSQSFVVFFSLLEWPKLNSGFSGFSGSSGYHDFHTFKATISKGSLIDNRFVTASLHQSSNLLEWGFKLSGVISDEGGDTSIEI